MDVFSEKQLNQISKASTAAPVIRTDPIRSSVDSFLSYVPSTVETLRSTAGITSNIPTNIKDRIDVLTKDSSVGNTMAALSEEAIGYIPSSIAQPVTKVLNNINTIAQKSMFGQKDETSVNFKVRLVSVLTMLQGAPGDIKQVVFEVTPTLSETRSVDYNTVQPIHMPGGIPVYKTTGSRTFELSAHLISRNTADALQNMLYLQVLRSWTMPFFGHSPTIDVTPPKTPPHTGAPMMTDKQLMKAGIAKVKSGPVRKGKAVSLLGAPPEVLYLYGYSSSSNDKRKSAKGVNINRIPVVLTSLNISYPEDVDYLPVAISPTANTEPFPIKMDISLSLLETHSPTEYERFSLEDFKSGKLANF